MEWMTLAEASDDVAIRGDRCPQCLRLPDLIRCAVEGGPAPAIFETSPLPVLRLQLHCPSGHAWAPRHRVHVRVAA